MGGGIGGGFAFYAQLGDLKSDLATLIGGVRTDIAVSIQKIDAVDARVKKIEVDSEASTASRRRIEEALVRVERRQTTPPPVFTPLVLSTDETSIIREHFRLKGPIKGPSRYSLGETLQDSQTVAIPEQLYLSIPKLKGFKYLIDPSGYVIIVSPMNLVAAIVGPPSA